MLIFVLSFGGGKKEDQEVQKQGWAYRRGSVSDPKLNYYNVSLLCCKAHAELCLINNAITAPFKLLLRPLIAADCVLFTWT